jgi:prepilin-type N-terminal cleavage/methylation domain-containing protein
MRNSNFGQRISIFDFPGRCSRARGFTLVEIVITLTIVIVIAAASIPTIRGIRDEQMAREPVLELSRMAKEVRLRAMKEKRPYQVAFHSGGFLASRYFNPYLQLADLDLMVREVESGVFRENPNEDVNLIDLDSGATIVPKTQLPLAPPGPALDNHWQERYDLPEGVRYSLKFWHDLEETPVEGEIVKLWVFQPSGICQPLQIHFEGPSALFSVEFGALTADIVKEVIDLR